jgi:hypothetical protein
MDPSAMRSARTARRWIWAALGLQLAGLLFDLVWHALLRPGVEPATRRAMLQHLLSVHLPLYIGVACVLATTAWAFVEQTRRARVAAWWWVALAGALLSAVGEAWHAGTHLQMDTDAGPLAGTLSVVGLVFVAVGVWRAPREPRDGAGVRRQPRPA